MRKIDNESIMNKITEFDMYHHIRMVRISFFCMSFMLGITLLIQLFLNIDFGGLPFLLFGIGVSISFSTLIVRIIIKWALSWR